MALPGEGTGDHSGEEETAPGGRGDCQQHRIEGLEETFRRAGHYANRVSAINGMNMVTSWEQGATRLPKDE